MTSEDLLNPGEEGLAAIIESTEEEIFDAMMKSQAAHGDSDVNGGDDDVDDNAVVVAGGPLIMHPEPMCRESRIWGCRRPQKLRKSVESPGFGADSYPVPR